MTRLLRHTTLSLTLVALTAACSSGKSGGGDGGGAAPAPANNNTNWNGNGNTWTPGQQGVYNLESYDNSRGHPQATILGTPIRNKSFFLKDGAGNNTGRVVNVQLSFDGNGQLSVAATIDSSLMQNPMANGAMSMDPWARAQNQAAPMVETFKGSNVPYYFHSVSGRLELYPFVAISSRTVTLENWQIGGGSNQARVAIGFSPAAIVKQRRHLGGLFTSTTVRSGGRAMTARLVDTLSGERLQDGNRGNFNPYTAGFDFSNKISVMAGEVVPYQTYSYNYNMNGQQNSPQTGVDFMFMPSFKYTGSLIYHRPYMDSQGI